MCRSSYGFGVLNPPSVHCSCSKQKAAVPIFVTRLEPSDCFFTHPPPPPPPSRSFSTSDDYSEGRNFDWSAEFMLSAARTPSSSNNTGGIFAKPFTIPSKQRKQWSRNRHSAGPSDCACTVQPCLARLPCNFAFVGINLHIYLI